MPLGLKERSSRLSAFVTLPSDDGSGSVASDTAVQGTNGHPIQSHTTGKPRSWPANGNNPPRASASPRPARSSAPMGRRDAGPGQPSLPPSFSPLKPTVSSALNDGNERPFDDPRDVFSGSQLGDSFMESGITTPQNEQVTKEEEEEGDDDVVEIGAELVRKLEKTNRSQRSPARPLHSQELGSGSYFDVGRDGYMTVMSKPVRHDPSNMRDGFRDAAVGNRNKQPDHYGNDRFRPSSPGTRDKLPLRDFKIRRSHIGRSEAYEEERPRPQSPAKQRPTPWNSARNEEVRPTTIDDSEDGVSVTTEEQVTPRAKRQVHVPQRSLLESPIPAQKLGLGQGQKRRRPASPEYDDMALSSMPFAELQNQPFDFDPSKEAEQRRAAGADAENLGAKLDDFRHHGENEQRELFANMSMEDWEASGDWFIEQFSSFVQALAQERRAKRRIIQEFEHEAAAREEGVRTKTDAIDRKLAKMKQDGQRVVQEGAL